MRHKNLFFRKCRVLLFLVLDYASINEELPGTFLRLSGFGRSLPNNLDLLLNGDLRHIDRLLRFTCGSQSLNLIRLNIQMY